MRVIITGANGQLAREVISAAPPDAELRPVSRAECDITQRAVVDELFTAFRPDIVINTAAFTAVDAAEDNADLAFQVNGTGAENIARAAARVSSLLIHVSTDYVFDGRSSAPYAPEAPANPLNVYGKSKLAGERLALAAAPDCIVVRAGWLYSTAGNNFLTRILGLLRGRAPLSVVNDQIGSPTSARELALAIWKMPAAQLKGLYHWSNAGTATWYEFAAKIAGLVCELGILDHVPPILPVATDAYPRRANRPAYSALDSTKLRAALGVRPCFWQTALRNEIVRGRPQILST